MIKILTAFFVLFFSYSVLATSVVVIPFIDADCSREQDDYVRLNRIAHVIKTDDLQRGEVVVEFYTDHGRCVDGEYKPLKIDKDAHLTFWKEGVNYPWTQLPFVDSLQLLDEKTAKVTIVFDINKLFKNKNVRKFGYWFTPEQNANYKWYIILEQTEEGSVNLLLERE